MSVQVRIRAALRAGRGLSRSLIRALQGRRDRNRSGAVKICVIGGDGFCGWPTALHLSQRGHDVVIIDDLSRRKIDVELEVESLTPIKPMSVRLAAWEEVSGRKIRFENVNVAKNYARLLYLLQ